MRRNTGAAGASPPPHHGLKPERTRKTSGRSMRLAILRRTLGNFLEKYYTILFFILESFYRFGAECAPRRGRGRSDMTLWIQIRDAAALPRIGTSESETLEFKREPWGKSDADRRE